MDDVETLKRELTVHKFQHRSAHTVRVSGRRVGENFAKAGPREKKHPARGGRGTGLDLVKIRASVTERGELFRIKKIRAMNRASSLQKALSALTTHWNLVQSP
eukprot:1384731-Amorphochlora_amoeboformis.AAC.1